MKYMSEALRKILFIITGLWVAVVCVSAFRWNILVEKPLWQAVLLNGSCLGLAWLWNKGACNQKILKFFEKKELKTTVWCIFFISFFVRLWIAADMQLIPTFDLTFVYDSAVYLAENGCLEYSDWLGYVSNNIPLIMFCSVIFKWAGKLGVENFYLVGGIVNALLIQISIFFTYKSIRLYVSENKALIVLLLCMLNPVFYVYVPYYYTDTVSMAFMMCFIFCFLKGMQNDGKRKYIYWGVAGVALAIGLTIRVTVLIAGIAGMLYLVMKTGRKQWKATVTGLVIMFLAVFCVRVGYEALYQKQVPEGVRENSLSVAHFIRMGTHGDGSYNNDDFLYTISLPNAEARSEENWRLIKAHFEEHGVKGFLKMQKEKIVSAWVVGSKGYEQYMQIPAKNSAIHPLLVGERSAVFSKYCQFYNFFLFALMLFTVIRRWHIREWDFYTYCMIVAVGSAIFYLFWEAQVRHTLCFYLILAVLATNVWDEKVPLEEKS